MPITRLIALNSRVSQNEATTIRPGCAYTPNLRLSLPSTKPCLPAETLQLSLPSMAEQQLNYGAFCPSRRILVRLWPHYSALGMDFWGF